jgi:hypothetical protein
MVAASDELHSTEEGGMTVAGIARKLCELWYLKLDKSETSYSVENYWERNKEYFTQRAKIYLEVKGSLEFPDNPQ